jgi:hypothetical protein
VLSLSLFLLGWELVKKLLGNLAVDKIASPVEKPHAV